MAKRSVCSQTVVDSNGVGKDEMFPGFWRQTLVHNDDLMLCLFTWRKGASLPAHDHPHRQAGFVISGSVELTVSGKTYVTNAGCSYIIQGNEEHSARAIEDSLVIDAFTPRREDYVPGPES
jgi:quercetin dioxygenase-like cupin family protein